MNEGYSLTIRADDGSTILRTDVEFMYQAFQRLIDCSAEVDRDVEALIRGPNGFCANHRIKASPDFTWIEGKTAISATSVSLQ